MTEPAAGITEEQKQNAINYARCARDFPFFVDNYCTIQDRKTEGPIPFKLWDSQKQVVPLLLMELLIICLKARQLGITWLVVCYCLWCAMFHFNELVLIISGDNENFSKEFVDRVKFVFDHLPDWMKPKVYKRNDLNLCFGEETTDSKTGIVKVTGLNSQIQGSAPTSSAGQSKTVSRLVMDEAALNRYCKPIYASSKPTLEHAAGQLIVISNPNKDKPGWAWVRKIYTDSMKGINNFKRIFLNWECVPGRGPDFLKQKRAEGMDEDDISLMYPTTEAEAISAMLGSYFGKSLVRHSFTEDGIKGDLVEKDGVYSFSEDSRGIVEIWTPHYTKQANWDGLEWVDRYGVGSDVSEGLGATSSTAYVFDRHTDEFVAKMSSNRVDAYEWAIMLKFIANYYNNAGHNACICAEKTGAGQTTVKKLKNDRQRQYVTIKADQTTHKPTKVYGWNETNNSKHEMSGDLKTYFKNTTGVVRCATLIDECSTYIKHDNGKIGHEDGKKDDHVIGAGLALQSCNMYQGPARQTKVREFTAAKREEEIKTLGGGASASAARMLDQTRAKYENEDEEEWT